MTLFTSERELKLEIHGLERNFPSSKVFGNQAAPHFPTTSNRLDHGFCCGGALISRWRWHFGIEGTGKFLLRNGPHSPVMRIVAGLIGGIG